jgi:hypothetical protein
VNDRVTLALQADDAVSLKTVVDAEIARQLQAIHDYMIARLIPVGGYKVEDCWTDIKAKVMALVQSDLPQISQNLGGLLTPPSDN